MVGQYILTPNPSSLHGGNGSFYLLFPALMCAVLRIIYSQHLHDASRMIEIGEKSFPQIFRQEGLAQKVPVFHLTHNIHIATFKNLTNVYFCSHVLDFMDCYLVFFCRWLGGSQLCAQHHYLISPRGTYDFLNSTSVGRLIGSNCGSRRAI